MFEFVCTKCKSRKKPATKIYLDETGKWHFECEECFRQGGKK